MPWPVKSTLMVSREREPVTGSTRTRRQRAGNHPRSGDDRPGSPGAVSGHVAD